MYFLFAGENFYPCGGMDDLVGSYGSIEEAREALDSDPFRSYEWYQIATVVDGRLVSVEE